MDKRRHPIWRGLWVVLVLVPHLLSEGGSQALPPSAYPCTEALALRLSYFSRSALNDSSAIRAAKWTLALLRIGVNRGEYAHTVLDLSLTSSENRAALIENLKARFLQAGLFEHPVSLMWEERGIRQQVSIRFEFPQDTESAYDEIREILLRPEVEAARKNKLPKNHADFLMITGDSSNRHALREISDPILKRNPLKIVARRVDTGEVVGFVYPVFVRAKDAVALPSTWVGMSEWLSTYELHVKDLNDWAMGDIWFTGGGNAAVAAAMLDASYELGKAMGISRFFAYSNPRALPMYWEKFPERHLELSAESYAARVIAPLVFDRLQPLMRTGRIRSWKQLQKQIARLVRRYAKDELSREVTSRIISEIRAQQALKGLPQAPGTPFSLEFGEELYLPFEKGGFMITDPAISYHLKRGSKLARIISRAFPEILGGPGVGGGYSFVMEYSVRLRDRFWMRFGERLGVGRASWHRYQDRRHAPRARSAQTPRTRLLIHRAA